MKKPTLGIIILGGIGILAGLNMAFIGIAENVRYSKPIIDIW